MKINSKTWILYDKITRKLTKFNNGDMPKFKFDLKNVPQQVELQNSYKYQINWG